VVGSAGAEVGVAAEAEAEGGTEPESSISRSPRAYARAHSVSWHVVRMRERGQEPETRGRNGRSCASLPGGRADRFLGAAQSRFTGRVEAYSGWLLSELLRGDGTSPSVCSRAAGGAGHDDTSHFTRRKSRKRLEVGEEPGPGTQWGSSSVRGVPTAPSTCWVAWCVASRRLAVYFGI
jgi:hypothetical protein